MGVAESESYNGEFELKGDPDSSRARGVTTGVHARGGHEPPRGDTARDVRRLVSCIRDARPCRHPGHNRVSLVRGRARGDGA